MILVEPSVDLLTREESFYEYVGVSLVRLRESVEEDWAMVAESERLEGRRFKLGGEGIPCVMEILQTLHPEPLSLPLLSPQEKGRDLIKEKIDYLKELELKEVKKLSKERLRGFGLFEKEEFLKLSSEIYRILPKEVYLQQFREGNSVVELTDLPESLLEHLPKELFVKFEELALDELFALPEKILRFLPREMRARFSSLDVNEIRRLKRKHLSVLPPVDKFEKKLKQLPVSCLKELPLETLMLFRKLGRRSFSALPSEVLSDLPQNVLNCFPPQYSHPTFPNLTVSKLLGFPCDSEITLSAVDPLFMDYALGTLVTGEKELIIDAERNFLSVNGEKVEVVNREIQNRALIAPLIDGPKRDFWLKILQQGTMARVTKDIFDSLLDKINREGDAEMGFLAQSVEDVMDSYKPEELWEKEVLKQYYRNYTVLNVWYNESMQKQVICGRKLFALRDISTGLPEEARQFIHVKVKVEGNFGEDLEHQPTAKCSYTFIPPEKLSSYLRKHMEQPAKKMDMRRQNESFFDNLKVFMSL